MRNKYGEILEDEQKREGAIKLMSQLFFWGISYLDFY